MDQGYFSCFPTAAPATMNGGRSIWAVSPEERDKHDQKFDTLSPVQGFVTGEQARSFFLQSGLPSSVLAEIWALADMNKDGKMDRLEFSIAMKLIKMTLQGQNLPSALPIIMKQPPVPAPTMPLTPVGMGAMQNIPLVPTVAVYTPMPLTSVSPMQGMSPLMASGMTLPIMPTITAPALANGPLGTLQPTPVNLTNAAPQNNYFTSSPLGFSSSHKTAVMDLGSGSSISSTTTSLVSGIPQSSPTDWAVPHSSRLKYRQQFNSLDRQMIGYLSGLQVRNAMGSTSLSQSQLATIWNLADVDNDGKLKADEFILAMHLVDMAKEGQVLPLALPVELVPPSLRGIVGDSLNESTSSSIYASLAEEFTDVDPPQKSKSNLTFEDKFKENLERGNAELEKRRLALREQQRKEDERRAQMAREEQERKEREAWELELRRMREEEQRLERQRELGRQREEERLKELERKEAAKKELERQRQLELEKKKKQDFQNQKSQEKEVIIHLKSKKRSLELELEAVGNKHKKISEKLRDAQAKKKVQKIELDHINQKRDGQIIEINLLQQQFEDLQRKLAQLTLEQHKLSEILQNMNMNMSASSMTLRKSVADKDLSCQKLKEQLDALEKEMAAKLSDMDQFKMDIRDRRENQRAQQSALDKLYSIKEDKIRELKRCKEEELEKKRQEEEEQRRIKQEKERQWQEKVRCDEEEKQRKLQKEREAKLLEEEERERQARLQAAKEQEERERRAQEEKERRQREAEEREKREEDKRKEQERKKFEEDRKKREEERKKIEEERRKLEVERRQLEEVRKRQEEERRRQEEEWRKEEKRRQEKERKQDELRRAEEERREEERRKEREEEERRRQRAQEAAIRDAEERKRKEVEQKWQEEEDRRRRDEERKKQEEERKKQEDERRRKQQEEHAVASARLNGEKQNNSKTDIVAALLRGLEERKGSRQPLGTSHRKSAALTKFKALYPFSARNDEELSFETGDIIEVDETVEREEGWLYGSLQAKMGWLPESYVEKQPKPETASKAALKLQALLSTSRLNDGSESNQNSAFTRTQAMGSMSTEHHQVVGKLQVKALCSWVAKTENHLNFSKDDVITVLEQQENWWLGELNGVQGWFPKTYVTVLSNSDLSADSTEGFESSSADAFSLEEYVALYTYESPEPGDLTFTEGDTILVSQTDGEWWRGSIGDRSGLFPSNYVKPKETDNSSLKPSVLGKKPEVAQVISAYTASGTGQLNLSPGQLIVILSKNHSGWWLGELQARGKKRQKGWFPALHVKQLGSNSGKSTPAIAPAVQVIAIYDYTAANQDELSFSKSQIINVLDKSDPDWWKGEINGIIGLIPTNYVKLTTSESDPSQQCK